MSDATRCPAILVAAATDAGKALSLYEVGSIRASNFHAWFASNPQAVAALSTRQTSTGGVAS